VSTLWSGPAAVSASMARLQGAAAVARVIKALPAHGLPAAR
jgi:hypothetical protein